MAKGNYTREQIAVCAYIRHCRDEFRKKGILHVAFARALGMSTANLRVICSFDKDNKCMPVPSQSTLDKYRERLDELLKYHDMENSECNPLLFT